MMLKGVGQMADYKRMYYSLFNEVTDVIERLQLAQQRTENIYLQADDAALHLEDSEQGDDT